jgi:hypothetical protein
LGLPIELIQDAEQYTPLDGGIYPDNMEAVSIFSDMSTQWNVGMSGATGLIYASLPVIFNIRRVKDRSDVFDCLQVMERAILAEMKS